MEEVVIARDTLKKIDQASEVLGVKKQELVDRAILLYLDNLNKYMSLKTEFKQWETLSDEALANFENSL